MMRKMKEAEGENFRGERVLEEAALKTFLGFSENAAASKLG